MFLCTNKIDVLKKQYRMSLPQTSGQQGRENMILLA
jgi:hypothetical protein